MTARVFVRPELLASDEVVLEGDAFRHLVRILRVEAGDSLGVFDGQGHEIDAQVVAITRQHIRLRLGARRVVPGPPARITLLQGLPRPERMDWIVEKATELGVAAIVPVVTERSQVHTVRPAAAPARLRRWQRLAQQAARQCGRAEVPEVYEPRPLSEAARDFGSTARATLGAGAPRCLVLWESGDHPPLAGQLSPADREVRLCIGPEGGLSARDLERLTAGGFLPISLGPRILRTETAAIATLAIVAAAVGNLEKTCKAPEGS